MERFHFIWIEKIVGRGEDALPLEIEEDGCRIVGVFDGLGGAGSGQVDTGNNVLRSEAAIAAELARKVSSHFFSNLRNDYPVNAIAKKFEGILERDFHDESKKLNRVPTKLKSSMFKCLPTTLAIARYIVDGQKTRLQVFWAGDSRVYKINSEGQLKCLTRDDCNHPRGTYALDYLASNGDAPMYNCISASDKFEVRCLEIIGGDNWAIFVCSDGLFSAFLDHSEFELAILSAIVGKKTYKELVSEITNNRTDDVSAAFIDFDLDETVKSNIQRRIQYLSNSIIPNKLSDEYIAYTQKILETFDTHHAPEQSSVSKSPPENEQITIDPPLVREGNSFPSGISGSQRVYIQVALQLALVVTYTVSILILGAGFFTALLKG